MSVAEGETGQPWMGCDSGEPDEEVRWVAAQGAVDRTLHFLVLKVNPEEGAIGGLELAWR